MNVIRKMVSVKNNAVTIKGLKLLNNKAVEVIIIPIGDDDKKNTHDRKKLMKYRGAASSGHNDTSRNADRVIYGR